jgi:4-hydroxythreonine-4-phosphate dehydrogenase
MGSRTHSKIHQRILITTGDSDGIGLEVTSKALARLGPQNNVQFVAIRQPSARTASVRGFRASKVADLNEVNALPFDPRTLVWVQSPLSPAQWVEQAARACLKGEFQALVTAPLSKTSIISAGMHDIGHTEILARVCKTRDLFMGFVGEKFCVVLATGHVPLAKACRQLNASLLSKALHAAKQLRLILPAARAAKPIALVGINPHAGEQGLIGREELWFKRAIAKDPQIQGPLVPDSAFLPHNWPRYSVYVCPYHDQGLIPFKLVHGFDHGVHLTLGLPFVRTSVDHGTAKDLFGQNRAQAGSMKEAISTAIELIGEDRR